jgi:hypothetical protein
MENGKDHKDHKKTKPFPPNGEGDTGVAEECIFCIKDILPPGQVMNLETYLADNSPTGLSTLLELCRALESGQITIEQLEQILDDVLPEGQDQRIADIIQWIEDHYAIAL